MKIFPVTISALLLAMSFTAAAEDSVHPEISSRFSLDLGLFYPERTLKLQAGVTSPGARSIDFGSELGLDRHDQMFAIDFGCASARNGRWPHSTSRPVEKGL